jgi:hypothetical protein
MNVFEPLFLLLVLTTLVTLIAAGVLAVAGRWPAAARLLRRWTIGALIYFAVVIVVSAAQPRRVYHVGDAQCFDDWCVAVAGAARGGPAPSTDYVVSLRLSNRARRVPMGEKDTVAYLVDAAGRRYDPRASAGDVPLDVRLQPGESRLVTRHYDVPLDARGLGLVYTHEGGFPIGWLIITEGGWFARPPIVELE